MTSPVMPPCGVRRSRFRRPASLALVLAAVAIATGSAQQSAPMPRPQFDTGTELVLVDVTVSDPTGEPIPDLTEADFDLEVNGQPRTIHSLQFVSTLPAPGTEPRAPSDDVISTNEGPTSGRLLLFVVDEGNLRVGAARTVLRTASLLMDRLSPGDLIGLARLPTGVGGVEFTTDRRRIAAALERVTGAVSARGMGPQLRLSEAAAFESGDTILWQQVVDRECARQGGLGFEACVETLQSEARLATAEASARSLATIRALEGLLTRLATLDTPVTIVMISEGLYVARDRQTLAGLARRAADAHASLHVVRPGQSFFDVEDRGSAGAGIFFDDAMLSEGLEQLAALTRGTVSQVSAGSGEAAFDRLGRELSGYYLIGFEPTAADRGGRERRIRVHVRRRGVTVRARPTFSIRETAATADAAAPQPLDRLKQLLGAPLPARGLPVRVASFTAVNPPDDRVRVIISAEIGGPATTPAQWPVGLLVVDGRDRVVASRIEPTTLSPGDGGESRRLLTTSVVLDPGEYTLRLAAIDDEGHEGSVQHTIRARLTSGPARIRIADLVLVPAAPAAGEAPKPRPAPLDREHVQALIEMSGGDERALDAARVRVRLSTTEGGPPLATVDARLRSRGPRHRAFGASLGLGILPPGDYVASAIVSMPGEDDVTVARHFRLGTITVRAADAVPAPPEIDPDAPAPPPPAPKILAPVPTFAASTVLRPEVVAPFLEGLLDLHPPSPTLAPVVESARRGRYAVPEPARGQTPDDEVTLAFIRGLRALEQNHVDQAAAWFTETSKRAEDFLGAAFYLGACHAASGRDREAIGAWQMALLSENPGAVYPLLVDALLRTGDGQQAADVLAEAPTAWADEHERLRREATAAAMLGDFETALPTLHALLAETRDPDAALLFLAIQVLYRVHAETGLDSASRARFAQYVGQYEKRKGPDLALVEAWKRAVLK